MSTSGDRCAYLDGSAYLLGFLFFFGRGEGSGAIFATAVTVVLLRFLGSIGDPDGDPVGCSVRVSVYWNFFSRSWKDADGVAS